jgi:hypothetical protein
MRRFKEWGLKRNTTEPVTNYLLNRVQDLYQHGHVHTLCAQYELVLTQVLGDR